ncbi:MAG: transposase [Sphingobacteriales bacterium]|nr:transposase [Sphingobacteriales bacterium]
MFKTNVSVPDVDTRLIPNICPTEFSALVRKLRFFFESKGFLEVHTQNRLSIMAACEDPKTIASYQYAGKLWPLPQTGQMWLEYELMTKPDVAGYFCLSTSYRLEPNPVVGRHNLIFPMFEFETHGGMQELETLERELLEYLGFGEANSFSGGNYEDVAKYYNTPTIEKEHETAIAEDFDKVFFLKYFPESTSPFWNMKRNDVHYNLANKMDVIIHGMETIGSAERSCDIEAMYKAFQTIENGKYAQKVYDLFGEDRVKRELEDFFTLNFIPRCGGGIGFGRLLQAMKLSNLL